MIAWKTIMPGTNYHNEVIKMKETYFSFLKAWARLTRVGSHISLREDAMCNNVFSNHHTALLYLKGNGTKILRNIKRYNYLNKRINYQKSKLSTHRSSQDGHNSLSNVMRLFWYFNIPKDTSLQIYLKARYSTVK